ncbi:MAG: amidohydrolase family protein [Proteobacteria bacterium]|nr:amidohydrolase family protein [Pseudomonadota bacterium]
MHDLVIRGGTLVDGTGEARRTADVAVDDGVITAVGKLGAAGRRELNADGAIVTPGWVDMHTHYDGQVTWDPYLTPSGWHGVTTVVMGNCGVGFAPAAPDRHEWLIGLMEGVEDIPGADLTEGITWGWETFPEYLDVLDSKPTAIDFGTQVPHGALRAYVMGERGAANEDATPEDIEAMSRIVEEGLRAGALGFSTSRTMLHRAADGRLMPGTMASHDELFGIARGLGRAGHGTFQIAAQHEDVPGELQWMRKLARDVGCQVSFNLSQIDSQPDLWREGLRIVEESAAEGLPIIAQVAGRAIGILFCWEGTGHPFMNRMPYLEVHQLPIAERLEQLRRPELREAICSADFWPIGEFEDYVTQSWHKMYPVGSDVVNYEPGPEESIAAVARRRGVRPEDIAYDALMEGDGKGFIYFPLFNYADNSLAPQHTLLNHKHTRLGLSDGGAHCGAICDGGMPTFMLTHWARDRSRGDRLGLEQTVRMQTRETAETFGLLDRGLVARGMKADLNLIDLEGLCLDAPQMVHDLPAGGRRLTQRAHGYLATVCSGTVIQERDEFTGELPGTLLRGPTGLPRGAR